MTLKINEMSIRKSGSNKLSHIDGDGNPAMVDVSSKPVTRRTAKARAVVFLGKEIMRELTAGELMTRKGPVFQTAILAGVMASKRTPELIPLCHSLTLEDCQVKIVVKGERVWLESSVVATAKTGAEMEALTAVAVAALTVYDMCKARSHDITIEQIQLLQKTGGKKTFKRE